MRRGESHAEACGSLHHIHDVKIMSPGFRPIFPRMSAGIGAHMPGLPIRRRTMFVILLQGGGVVRGFITEQSAEIREPFAVGDQPIPIIMGDLVSQMSEQSSMWFMEIHTTAFPLIVIGFGNINDNQTIEMPRQRAGAARLITDKAESEWRTMFFGHAFQRKAQPHDGVKNAAFGYFQFMPAVQIAWKRQIWNQRIEPAREAKGIRIIRRDHPVADFMLLAVITEVIELVILGFGQSPPRTVLDRFQCGELSRARQKPQHVTAGDTFHVFKENETATTIAVKCFHAIQGESNRSFKPQAMRRASFTEQFRHDKNQNGAPKPAAGQQINQGKANRGKHRYDR
jgi:hypothetical protein